MLTNSKKPWRVSSNHRAGIAMLAALAAAPVYVAQTGFAQELIARASSDLQASELIGWRRIKLAHPPKGSLFPANREEREVICSA